MIKRILLCITLSLLAVSTLSCDQSPCKKGHVEMAQEEILPTCAQAGKTAGKYCGVCGEVLTAQQEVPPSGHTESVKAAVSPTCTASGHTEGRHCIVCNEILVVSQEIPALGHAEQTIAAVSATCTESGRTEGKQCATCGEILTASQEISPLGHVVRTDAAAVPTCTESGHTERKQCSVCHEILKPSTVIAPLGHKTSTIPAVQPTCTERGWTAGEQCITCERIVTAQVEIPALGHTVVSSSAVAATCTQTGLTAGSYCSVCQTILTPQTTVEPQGHIWMTEKQVALSCAMNQTAEKIYCAVCGYTEQDTDTIKQLSHSFEHNRCTACGIAQDFSDVSLYAGTWFYEYCATLEKGEAYQELYRRIDEAVSVFHATNAEVLWIADSGLGMAVTVPYGDLGLKVDDLRLVRMFYHYDHPLYYWMSGTFRYGSGTLGLYVNTVYIDSEVRKDINQKLYAHLAQIAESVAGVTSTYDLTLAYHDAITAMMDYARQANGKAVEPQDARWAYNIVGPFVLGSGVCRGYAEAFSLLLNYSGITNLVTRGVADVAHRWNQVLMEDGQWYWFDLTWDDAPKTELGVTYHYFCVSDKQEVGWKDQDVKGSYSLGNGTTFFYKHTPDFDYEADNYVFDLQYPDCADEPYDDPTHLNLRDTFTIDGLTYALIGYRKVQVIEISGSGRVVIPREVVYQDIKYTVIAIGSMDVETKLMMQCAPVTKSVREIVIPETVTYIGIQALSKVENVLLNSENTAFYIQDGVLYDVVNHRSLAKATQDDTQ